MKVKDISSGQVIKMLLGSTSNSGVTGDTADHYSLVSQPPTCLVVESADIEPGTLKWRAGAPPMHVRQDLCHICLEQNVSCGEREGGIREQWITERIAGLDYNNNSDITWIYVYLGIRNVKYRARIVARFASYL